MKGPPAATEALSTSCTKMKGPPAGTEALSTSNSVMVSISIWLHVQGLPIILCLLLRYVDRTGYVRMLTMYLCTAVRVTVITKNIIAFFSFCRPHSRGANKARVGNFSWPKHKPPLVASFFFTWFQYVPVPGSNETGLPATVPVFGPCRSYFVLFHSL